ncbi:hypothetical protein JOF29_005731 [Kribbella aluminosa]|uniref:Uncharacterized protein n=1 Tax=Kribbella aluminosa TaxID=416017 RepID=A0ABS4USK0_9ACTN|nr:hypothetical protein [Kribbella aluminosa]MBP2354621.1 hypothetical protein [Kribbella aluminosa]
MTDQVNAPLEIHSLWQLVLALRSFWATTESYGNEPASGSKQCWTTTPLTAAP